MGRCRVRLCTAPNARVGLGSKGSISVNHERFGRRAQVVGPFRQAGGLVMSLNTMGSASTKPPAVMGRFLASCSAAKAPAVASPPCRHAALPGRGGCCCAMQWPAVETGTRIRTEIRPRKFSKVKPPQLRVWCSSAPAQVFSMAPIAAFRMNLDRAPGDVPCPSVFRRSRRRRGRSSSRLQP